MRRRIEDFTFHLGSRVDRKEMKMVAFGQMMRNRTTMSLACLGLLGAGLGSGIANAESRRICDVPMEWKYTKPAPDVPAEYQRLLGLWTGAARFIGSSESSSMCIAVAIHDIRADGQTLSIFAWNLGGGSESTNQISMGSAQWMAQSILLLPEKGEQLIFAADAPYRGRWYRYILDLPTAAKPDEISGFLYASKQGSAKDPSLAAWTDLVEAHRVVLMRHKDSPLKFAVPTN